MAKREVDIGGVKLETFDGVYGGRTSRILFADFETSEKLYEAREKMEQHFISRNDTNFFTDRAYRQGQSRPDRDFVGTTDLNEVNNPQNIAQFAFPNALNDALNNLGSVTQDLELGGGVKKKKLIMSSQPIGVFNFPAAAIGLYRKAEYFSPADNFVVDKSLVQGNSSNGFFFTQNGQRKVLEQRQENTTEMLRINPNAKPKMTNSGMLYTDPIKYKNVMLKFGTTNKKVYLVKSNIKNVQNKGKEKYVDMYLIPEILGDIEKENLLYSALPSFLVAQILEAAGFKVNIKKVILNVNSGNVVFLAVSLKDYGQPIDVNKLMVQTADTRVYRWDDFRNYGIFAKAAFNQDIGAGIGGTLGTTGVRQAFNDYKHWLKKKIEKGEIKAFNKNVNLHINGSMEATNDPQNDQYENVRNLLTTILDQIAIEFSGADKAIVEAIKRDINAKTKVEIIRDFEGALAALTPVQPTDTDLRDSDPNFQSRINEHNRNTQTFQQIKPTL